MKSSIIGERLTVAAFLLILSASMVGLSLSIKNPRPHRHKVVHSNLKLGKQEHSNKEKDGVGCECMLRTVSISFRNFGLLADLDQVMLPLSKKEFTPVEQEQQETVRNNKKKFLHGTCPDKFVSDKNSYPSVTSAQEKHVKNNNKTVDPSNVGKVKDTQQHFKPTRNTKQLDPWSVNVVRCLGTCSPTTTMPPNVKFTNNTFSALYNSGMGTKGERTNIDDLGSGNNSNVPAIEDDKLNGSPLNKINFLLQSQTTFVCLPILSKRKKISIRIPWNMPPRDFTPSNDEAKLKSSTSDSDSFKSHAQIR